MSPAQTVNFMAVLGATLARSGLATRAECCASIGWNYAQRYAAAIAADKAANTGTALFTSHGYTAAPDSPLRGWSKAVWETEWAPFDTGLFDPAWDDGSQLSGFTWAQNFYTGLTKADLSVFLYLWGASTTAITGPNTGLVDVKGDTVATSGRLWAFAKLQSLLGRHGPPPREQLGRRRGHHHALAAIVLAILAPIAAYMVQFAISRRREYLADATGVQLTRKLATPWGWPAPYRRSPRTPSPCATATVPRRICTSPTRSRRPRPRPASLTPIRRSRSASTSCWRWRTRDRQRSWAARPLKLAMRRTAPPRPGGNVGQTHAGPHGPLLRLRRRRPRRPVRPAPRREPKAAPAVLPAVPA